MSFSEENRHDFKVCCSTDNYVEEYFQYNALSNEKMRIPFQDVFWEGHDSAALKCSSVLLFCFIVFEINHLLSLPLNNLSDKIISSLCRH